MRLIDADALKAKFMSWLPTDPQEGGTEVENIAVSAIMEIDDAPTVDVAPLTPPQALTLDELRAWTMGKPLFIRLLPPCQSERWEIPQVIARRADRVICRGSEVYFMDDYGKTWTAYPTEPGRE